MSLRDFDSRIRELQRQIVSIGEEIDDFENRTLANIVSDDPDWSPQRRVVSYCETARRYLGRSRDCLEAARDDITRAIRLEDL